MKIEQIQMIGMIWVLHIAEESEDIKEFYQDSFEWGIRGFDCIGDKKHSKTVGETTKQ